MGCMGLIYSVTLAVQPLFYLREVRTLSTWSQVRKELALGEVLAAERSTTSCSSILIRTSGERSNASSPPAIRWLPRNIATIGVAAAVC